MMIASLNLSALDGDNGFILNGIDGDDYSGRSVSGAGDINGDGLDDLIIGANGADDNTGESYVVFGKSSGFSASLDLSTLTGSNGFVLTGIDSDYDSGFSVSGAGDVNGDGLDDLIIGAYAADPNGNIVAGESYVVFGKSSGFGASLDLSTLTGSNGFVLNGIDSDDRSGFSVSGAGDVNGDGLDDLIIGAYNASPNGNSYAGESYVVFGKSSGFSASLDLSTLNGSNGFVLNGIDGDDYSGRSVSGAGDINGDGFDDLIIGADAADNDTGESYVVFGKSSGFSASLDLSTLNGSNGFVLNGVEDNDISGFSVSGAGDVNGDGLDDLIIGAYNASSNGNRNTGESYVVFGKSSGFSASLDLSTLNGNNGFVLNGIDSFDNAGYSVSGAGDVNGDGFDDLVIGANGADPNGNSEAGESYVVFGKSSGFSASLDLSTLTGSNGFVLNGIDSDDVSGSSVSGAGDVNGDGFDDLIIGAYRASPNGNSYAGESYVILGGTYGTSEAEEIRGGGSNNRIIAFAGDDTVRGGLGDDTLYGGQGNDLLGGAAGNDRILGGEGADTVNGGDNDDVLDGGQGNDTIRGGIDNDAIHGGEGDDELFGEAGNDTVSGGSGDDLLRGGRGNDTLSAMVGVSVDPGVQDIDTLTGGSGEDTFELVTAPSSATGFSDRAEITDLNLQEDEILVAGLASNYSFGVSGADTNIFFNNPTSGMQELVAVVKGITDTNAVENVLIGTGSFA